MGPESPWPPPRLPLLSGPLSFFENLPGGILRPFYFILFYPPPPASLSTLGAALLFRESPWPGGIDFSVSFAPGVFALSHSCRLFSRSCSGLSRATPTVQRRVGGPPPLRAHATSANGNADSMPELGHGHCKPRHCAVRTGHRVIFGHGRTGPAMHRATASGHASGAGLFSLSAKIATAADLADRRLPASPIS